MKNMLRQALSFGDATYARSFNQIPDNRRIEYVLETLLRRIEAKFISHDEYFIPIRGLQWAIQTGRVYQSGKFHRLKLQGILRLIEDIKRNCSTFSEVESYLQQLPR